MRVQVAIEEGEERELVDRAVVVLGRAQRDADDPRRVPEDPLVAALALLFRRVAAELALRRLAWVGRRGRAGQEPGRVRQVAHQNHEHRGDDAGCYCTSFPTRPAWRLRDTEKRRQGEFSRSNLLVSSSPCLLVRGF